MTSQTILFLHQSFPGQFRNVAASLAADGHNVYGLALNPQGPVPGVKVLRYAPTRKQVDDLPWLMREMDAKILRAESVFLALMELRKQGLEPDVVYVHPGWGEALFIRNVWPQTRLVVYAEWFYNEVGQEVNFDKEFPYLSPPDGLRLTLKNTCFLHALNDADAAITPTHWQKNRFPGWAQEKIEVIHDGLDMAALHSSPPQKIHIPPLGLDLRSGMPIVTFVARHLEPVRGFHTFMRALPDVLHARPDAHVLILGNDAGHIGKGYGRAQDQGKTWRQALTEELGTHMTAQDWARVHFLGSVPYPVFVAALKMSACHVYLTTPFILSWSFLEAVTLGLPIIASDTAPVLEFSRCNGVELTPFGDAKTLSRKILARLKKPLARTPNALPELELEHTLPRIKGILLGEGAMLPQLAPKPAAAPKQAKPKTAEPKPAEPDAPQNAEALPGKTTQARGRGKRKQTESGNKTK